ncbi:hypothetical protein [Streptomyces sp. HUAS TT20]|uniref:hypothetical protein n=1 Tax=Streptomyces sp. HUAS TT20 TaxID=3447509 RepID=UPI0021DB39D7|nr:hypothetical protein [Streptomyces sp. HUAS 15-9]UXY27500.1 hypothetical protein N8I87_13500 [Streptomyces sp. HUAS 15-9]
MTEIAPPPRPVRERHLISDLIEKVGRDLLAQDNPSNEAIGVFADLIQAHADLLAARTGSLANFYASRG